MHSPSLDRPAGVFAAVLTPFDDDGAPDSAALALHCRWLLANGCDGLSIMGTTGEANSLSVDERLRLMEKLVEDGIPARMLLPGTGCCAIPDSVRLSARATQLGVAGVLLLPPFYYKSVRDEGVFAAVSEIIERVGDPRLRIYLYHFPQMTAVPFGPALIERLSDRWPQTIAGMKDSSGDLGGMTGNAARFPHLGVFSGSDELLLPLLRAGGAGCITGVSNIAARLAAEVWSAWRRGDDATAAAAQARLDAVRRVFLSYPLAAALKEVLAAHTGRSRWRRLRPPLLPLAGDEGTALREALHHLGFAPAPMP
ncbi:MAG TPA: dihydrodipicolinate synthase family protein [Rhodospirillales bacterium]|nr:dihydrodipicolinate synthase family protein [Rhodospirillales bacterium]